MPKTKQTARKTTGKHLAMLDALACQFLAASNPKRVQHRPTITSSPGPNGSRFQPLAPIKPKSILKRHSVAVSSPPGSSDPVSAPPDASLPHVRLEVPLSADGSSTNGVSIESGALIRLRPAAGVLDMPISICTRFATWLENQTCVPNETLIRAVERDGSHLLSLAKATVAFDNALHGRVPPAVSGLASPLVEHARTLRVFAELLKRKISEGGLSEELAAAVLRDGEALLPFAISCLEFDQALRGSDSTQVK